MKTDQTHILKIKIIINLTLNKTKDQIKYIEKRAFGNKIKNTSFLDSLPF